MLDADVELVTIRTSGDESSTTLPSVLGDKSRFVKELEDALLRGEIDLAVHSAKDVPAELPEGLAIVGVPARADPRDALCGCPALDELPEGARVGTGSLRRRSQLLARRPDLRVEELRGNVDTRLRRLAEGGYDALVLAAAGLARLGREEGEPIDTALMLPAAGQGCLALQARAGDSDLAELAGAVTDRSALTALTAERALVSALDASCHTPLAAYAEVGVEREGGAGGTLRLRAFAGLPDGSHWIGDSLEGGAAEPAALGRAVAERMLAAGAAEVLAEAERAAQPR
ncbi:MAG: hydroxymethylbilane synthase [Thermoleophilaceae bacterium]|jgi:hydroxymethylbilane synthase|nr:hydroxymethylbilane synthase [Thermoleophilaceae bacterium]